MISKNDRVRIRKLINNYHFVQDAQNRRKPRQGDIAEVVEVYRGPPMGYKLECRDPSGNRAWMLGFTADEIELEKVST